MTYNVFSGTLNPTHSLTLTGYAPGNSSHKVVGATSSEGFPST